MLLFSCPRRLPLENRTPVLPFSPPLLSNAAISAKLFFDRLCELKRTTKFAIICSFINSANQSGQCDGERKILIHSQRDWQTDQNYQYEFQKHTPTSASVWFRFSLSLSLSFRIDAAGRRQLTRTFSVAKLQVKLQSEPVPSFLFALRCFSAAKIRKFASKYTSTTNKQAFHVLISLSIPLRI